MFSSGPAAPQLPANNQPAIDPELKKLRLPQLEIPKPKAKMKTLNWVKLPDNKVIGSWVEHSNSFEFVDSRPEKIAPSPVKLL